MAEQIIALLNKISAIKGEEYVKGLVDGINLASPDTSQEIAPCNDES